MSDIHKKETAASVIFRNRDTLLALYNFLNRSDYTDEKVLETVRVDRTILVSVRNDNTYMIDFELFLLGKKWDKQLDFISEHFPVLVSRYRVMMAKLQEDRLQLGGTNIPYFCIFHNGTGMYGERQVFKFSQEYLDDDTISVLKVMVFQLAPGLNEQLLRSCKALQGYATYTELVRANLKKGLLKEDAVVYAADYCRKNRLLPENSEQTWNRIVDASLREVNQTVDKNMTIISERDTGFREGMEAGMQEASKHIRQLQKKLQSLERENYYLKMER